MKRNNMRLVIVIMLMVITSLFLLSSVQVVLADNVNSVNANLAGIEQTYPDPSKPGPLDGAIIMPGDKFNDSNFSWIAMFALSAMVINSIGIFMMYKHRKWALANKEHFMCFAAGMLITSSLIMVFPEAMRISEEAGLAALAGFMFMYFGNKLSHKVACDKNKAFGITALAGIGIHSLMDGVIYSVTFNASVATGILAGIGLVAHEFAEGVITFALLTKAGVGKKKSIVVAFFVAALTTPIGAFISFPLVQYWSKSMTGLSLGFVSGVLIYTSASHLLPEVENSGKKHSHISMVIGVGLAIAMLVIGH